MLIDASVHPVVETADQLRDYMDMPWKKRVFSPVHRYSYSSPASEFWEPARTGHGLPGSDVGHAAQTLFDDNRVDVAVLLPLTRGINMDSAVSTAVCAATNDWLADVWLGSANEHGRFKGTIRVNPRDPKGAEAEIKRWADHPHMVQVGVPTMALAPYGEPQYAPIWEAAAAAGLPVAVHVDGGSGLEFPTSPVGSFNSHIEWSTFMSANGVYHLASLIVHGVFERVPELRFVFADGGIDLAVPMIWRMIADYRAGTDLHPWSQKSPPDYLRPHVRFVSNRMEGPTESADWAQWLQVTDATNLLLYGSDYPHWTYALPAALEDAGDARERILGANAAAFYPRLDAADRETTQEGSPA